MHDLRWQQRFENFERAFLLLREALLGQPIAVRSDLEKEGVIQRFEYTFELAWKTLRDYLEYGGVALEPVTPRAVIKAAFAAQIIADGQVWITMLEQRNLMAHTYDREKFEVAITGIAGHFFPAIEQVYLYLKAKSDES